MMIDYIDIGIKTGFTILIILGTDLIKIPLKTCKHRDLTSLIPYTPILLSFVFAVILGFVFGFSIKSCIQDTFSLSASSVLSYDLIIKKWEKYKNQIMEKKENENATIQTDGQQMDK